jgi:hypothetical protein
VKTKRVVGFSAGNRFALIQFSDGSSRRIHDGDEWDDEASALQISLGKVRLERDEGDVARRRAERTVADIKTDLAVERGRVRGLEIGVKDIEQRLKIVKAERDKFRKQQLYQEQARQRAEDEAASLRSQLEAERVDTDLALKARNKAEATLAETSAALEKEREARRAAEDGLSALTDRVEHLRKYARHWQKCPRIVTPNEECTCGFDDARAPRAFSSTTGRHSCSAPSEAVGLSSAPGWTDSSVPRGLIVMIRELARNGVTSTTAMRCARDRIVDQCNLLLGEEGR